MQRCVTPRGRRELQDGGCRPPCLSGGLDRPKHTNTILMIRVKINNVTDDCFLPAPLVISHVIRSTVKRVFGSMQRFSILGSGAQMGSFVFQTKDFNGCCCLSISFLLWAIIRRIFCRSWNSSDYVILKIS